MHFMDGYEEAAGKSSDAGDDGRKSEGFDREGTDEGDEESCPALVEDQVHHH